MCELGYGKPINCANTNSVISLSEESYYIYVANIILQEENWIPWTQKVENYFFTVVPMFTVERSIFVGKLLGHFCTKNITSVYRFVTATSIQMQLIKDVAQVLRPLMNLEKVPAAMHP